MFNNTTCEYDLLKHIKCRLATPLPCCNNITYYMSKQYGNMGKRDLVAQSPLCRQYMNINKCYLKII